VSSHTECQEREREGERERRRERERENGKRESLKEAGGRAGLIQNGGARAVDSGAEEKTRGDHAAKSTTTTEPQWRRRRRRVLFGAQEMRAKTYSSASPKAPNRNRTHICSCRLQLVSF
jgi:hypothetical protein